VLHRDAHLLAVAKPRGLPTIPNGGGFLTHTLLHLVRGLAPAASPLHRLGRGTSGLVLFGLTGEARAAVSAAWRTPAVVKVYRALVRGVPARDAFTVDAPIGPVPHPRLGRVHAVSASGRASSLARRRAGRARRQRARRRRDRHRPPAPDPHPPGGGGPSARRRPSLRGGGLPLPEPGLPGDLGYRLHAHT
jgi:23S rRNA pseudouridine1911/1915/1917 synthase